MNKTSLPFDSTLFIPGSRICVAVSGGADSVALLSALSAANKTTLTPLGVGISAVHVHHGLRGEEADIDQFFVQKLCDRLEISLQVHRVDVASHCLATRETVEQAARTLRYRVFSTVLSGSNVDDLVTAHTLDDQAETVIMKLLRGAWTEGLGGIHPVLRPIQAKDKRILRPLLRTSRQQVLTYLTENEQPWREDTTNTDPTHTRNRIRHQILPLLRTENPSLSQTLANLAELAREEEEHWQKELARRLPQLLLPGSPVRGGGRSVSTNVGENAVALEIDRLRSLDNPTRRRVLRAAARSLYTLESETSGVRLSFDETNRLLAFCGFRYDPSATSRLGSVICLSQGLSAKRSARELLLFLKAPIPAKIRL